MRTALDKSKPKLRASLTCTSCCRFESCCRLRELRWAPVFFAREESSHYVEGYTSDVGEGIIQHGAHEALNRYVRCPPITNTNIL